MLCVWILFVWAFFFLPPIFCSISRKKYLIRYKKDYKIWEFLIFITILVQSLPPYPSPPPTPPLTPPKRKKTPVFWDWFNVVYPVTIQLWMLKIRFLYLLFYMYLYKYLLFYFVYEGFLLRQSYVQMYMYITQLCLTQWLLVQFSLKYMYMYRTVWSTRTVQSLYCRTQG